MKRREVLKQIRKYSYQSRWSVLLLIVSGVLSVPVTLIAPKFFQILIDNVMKGGQLEQFKIVIMGLIGVYIARFALDAANLYFGNRLLNRFTLSIRKDLLNKVLKASYPLLQKLKVGDVKMRIMDDVGYLGSFIREQVSDYFFHVLMVAFSLYMTLNINVKMTLYCITIIPLVFLINMLIGRGTKKINEKIRDVNREYKSFVYNTLSFWKEIKTQCAEGRFIDKFRNFRAVFARLELTSITYWAYTEIFDDFKANYLTKVFVYIVGAFFVIKNQISVGVLILFAEYFTMLFSSLDKINAKNVSLKTNSPYYTRVFETLSMEGVGDKGKPNTQLHGNIEINNLFFGYDGKKNVLENISFQVHTGAHIVIVGRSGCGKTTLAKLLLGLYPPEKGTILFEGVDISEISKTCLYGQIGTVMQDHFLFSGSIRENLSVSKGNADEAELILACKAANIYEFVTSLPQGLDTIIGEQGVKLSGGQKQRIAIAGALLRKPRILLFDEATSALDKESEDRINDYIQKYCVDTTVIAISHKPATIMKAEIVIVMDEGRIVDMGTHEELIKRNEFYKKLAA